MIIAILLAGIACVFIAKIKLSGMNKPGSDNCIGDVIAKTVIVLDHSDAISEQTLTEIIARSMHHVNDKVAINELVSIFTVSDLSKKSLTPIFSACKPPETGNRLYENQKMIEKRFREIFIKPLEEKIKHPYEDSKESPIAQALIDLSLSDYLRAKHSNLLVFSDMLENTSRFSVYNCQQPGVDEIKQFRNSRKGGQERPEFKNVSVLLNIIPRTDISSTTTQCRDYLWVWFFGDNDGTEALLSSDYLPGGDTK